MSGRRFRGARLRLVVAVLVAASAVYTLWITGGLGALAAALGAASIGVLLRRRRGAPGRRPGAELVTVAAVLVAVLVVWNSVSFARDVIPDNGDALSERAVTWARDHGFDGLVDYVESKWYSEPPSKVPARRLALNEAMAAPATTPSASTVSSSTTSTAAASATTATGSATEGSAATGAVATAAPAVAPPTAAASPVPASTEPAAPAAPADLAVPITPALPGEGQWQPIATAGGSTAVWATSIRPLAAVGGVVASIAEIDQTDLRAGLFNGGEEPGGQWQRSNRVPDELQPALVAALNGGFRFQHIKGGYVTEGRVVKPLRDGDATLAIGRDGRMVLGRLGRDLTDDGSWVSLRQNLILIVDGGVSQVQEGIRQGVWWGADYGREVYVPRSAVCELADGRLAYALVSKVDAFQLADALVAIGCQKAIQLDINGTWPVFFTFAHTADGGIEPRFLDQRMGGNPSRYLTGSTKEFFAFFDRGLLPATSVLDA